MGSLVVYMALLPVTHLMVTCCGKCFKKSKVWFYLRKNFEYKTYLNFYVGYQIIFLTSTIIYMRLSKTYYGDYISATRLLTFEFYLSLFFLASSFILISGLLIVACAKRWWRLKAELV